VGQRMFGGVWVVREREEWVVSEGDSPDKALVDDLDIIEEALVDLVDVLDTCAASRVR
jgi:hypothetical protein